MWPFRWAKPKQYDEDDEPDFDRFEPCDYCDEDPRPALTGIPVNEWPKTLAVMHEKLCRQLLRLRKLADTAKQERDLINTQFNKSIRLLEGSVTETENTLDLIITTMQEIQLPDGTYIRDPSINYQQ